MSSHNLQLLVLLKLIELLLLNEGSQFRIILQEPLEIDPLLEIFIETEQWRCNPPSGWREVHFSPGRSPVFSGAGALRQGR